MLTLTMLVNIEIFMNRESRIKRHCFLQKIIFVFGSSFD